MFSIIDLIELDAKLDQYMIGFITLNRAEGV